MGEAAGEPRIRFARAEDVEAIGRVAGAAWERILQHFAESQEQALGELVHARCPEDKAREVMRYTREHLDNVLVTEVDGKVVGFVTMVARPETGIGTIGNNGLDPAYTGRGLGSRQLERALDVLRERGMRAAELVTGLDKSHARARRMYERAGFVQVHQSVEYMKLL